MENRTLSFSRPSEAQADGQTALRFAPEESAPAERRSIRTLTEDILWRKNRAGMDMLEIGRDLIEAKAQLSHGEWMTWLREEVDFSQSSANNFMRIAREIDSGSSLAKLPYTKVLALLDVPAEERERFAQEHDAEHRTAAEIRRLTEELKAQRARADRAESANALQTEKLQRQQITIRDLTRAADAEQEKRRTAEEQLAKALQREPTVIRETPEDYEAVKAALAAAEAESDRLAEELDRVKLASAKAEMDNGMDAARILSDIGGFCAVVGQLPARIREGRICLSRADAELIAGRVAVVAAWCDAMQRTLGGLSDE